MFFVCEALSVPATAAAAGPSGGTDLYKVCVTCSLSPFCSLSSLSAGFGVYLRDIMCLWLHARACKRVCVEEEASAGAAASSHQVNFTRD